MPSSKTNTAAISIEGKKELKQETIIFGIQRFSIHDGPGIRTLVFFKGCNLRCNWCSNPESQNFGQELFYHPEKCTKCLKCVEACPNKAIQVDEDGKIDFKRNLCRNCGKCTIVCMSKARILKGQTINVQELMKEIKKDSDFYASSGGGVTLGGGDPLTCPEFAREILIECKAAGIHTAIETAGHFDWPVFEMVLPFTDLFLFDLKHLDPEIHKVYIGVDNRLILDNLAKLAAAAKSIVVRTPVIPGFNDQEAAIRAIAEYVASLKISEYQLLPYHQYGVEKYRYLGREYQFTGDQKIDEATIKRLKQLASLDNLNVRIGG